MQQRDLLKDQIEQLGRILGKIWTGFLGLKSKGQITAGIEMANKQLDEELDININQLFHLSKTELKDYLTARKFSAPHMETLAIYLRELGLYKMNVDTSESRKILTTALEMLELADEFTKTFSFERKNLKAAIQQILNDI